MGLLLVRPEVRPGNKAATPGRRRNLAAEGTAPHAGAAHYSLDRHVRAANDGDYAAVVVLAAAWEGFTNP